MGTNRPKMKPKAKAQTQGPRRRYWDPYRIKSETAAHDRPLSHEDEKLSKGGCSRQSAWCLLGWVRGRGIHRERHDRREDRPHRRHAEGGGGASPAARRSHKRRNGASSPTPSSRPISARRTPTSRLRLMSIVARRRRGAWRTSDVNRWDWSMLDRVHFAECFVPRLQDRHTASARGARSPASAAPRSMGRAQASPEVGAGLPRPPRGPGRGSFRATQGDVLREGASAGPAPGRGSKDTAVSEPPTPSRSRPTNRAARTWPAIPFTRRGRGAETRGHGGGPTVQMSPQGSAHSEQTQTSRFFQASFSAQSAATTFRMQLWHLRVGDARGCPL